MSVSAEAMKIIREKQAEIDRLRAEVERLKAEWNQQAKFWNANTLKDAAELTALRAVAEAAREVVAAYEDPDRDMTAEHIELCKALVSLEPKAGDDVPKVTINGANDALGVTFRPQKDES